ncbi:biotin synthesis protein BioC [Lentisphaera araneosa HTCC2155]|uniref:Biotin synthesis protein BioC n=1 Tax=Lentisphaera araneosa HTCC2155 TaxID=313628 RepID=A6DS28_9BACT|nr:methyltransferase domain-containing protein [Lentisphaera araneosa]EDM25603.1 biotin synthesis protein BioC [Lentisphaera araneosa HTCC2155]
MSRGHFNNHAADYDQYAHIQRRIANTLIQEIPKETAPKRILEIGAGTAYISQQLMGIFPYSEFYICDPALQMIEVAKEKLGNKAQYQICELPNDDQGFDLIITSMAIQWVPDWNLWMQKVAELANPNATLLIATPTMGTLSFLPKAFEAAEMDYKGLNYRDAKSLRTSAEHYFNKVNKFTLPFSESFESSIDFFKKIHRIGANVEEEQLNPGQLRKLIKECEKLKRDNILEARYEVTFLQAHKS